MHSFKKDRINLPISLLKLVWDNNLGRVFKLYLYLSCISDGIINKLDIDVPAVQKAIGIKDRRTYAKYLAQLHSLNWIGLNHDSGNYFIRGIKRVCTISNLKLDKNAEFSIKNIKRINQFIVAALVSEPIYRQKNYKEIVLPRLAEHALKRDGALQCSAGLKNKDYYSLSLKSISELLCCSISRASELKTKSKSAKFIRVKKHYRLIKKLSKPDFKIRTFLYESNPDLLGKIVFRKNRNGKIRVMEQRADEIIPQISIKNLKN